MSDLRLKVRNKIYTSGNHIVDTKNNNNAVIVFLGEMSADALKPYIDNFLEDTLKSQIPSNKISFVQIKAGEINELPQKLASAVKSIAFNPIMRNELYISFVTIMDDDIYETEQMIDVSAIEELKISALGGYSVETFYDFYGIFTSSAKYSNRLNARKTITAFLNTENGGLNVRKRVYHQACPGDDYYRSAKSITFMILINLIEKINHHTVLDSTVEGDNYTWTTFALFEKNLAALVVYEMIDKLLENQVNGTEIISREHIYQYLVDVMKQEEAKLKKLASANDIGYIPIIVRKNERELSFVEKSFNLFKKEKVSPIEYIKVGEEESINDLLKRQQQIISQYVNESVTEEFMETLIIDIIKKCTVMESINNHQNEALIYSALNLLKNNFVQEAQHQMNDYDGRYKKIILGAQAEIVDKIIVFFNNNVNRYVAMVQQQWNALNMEVDSLINDFAAFQDYFEGIGDLISDKAVNLLCNYDDILDKIDIQSVIRAINQNPEIYSNILSSYYDNVQVAGEIAQRFGNCNIVPELGDIAYYLFSSSYVACPGRLNIVSDEYWFREYEIAILFTAKNKISDCNNLPFQA